MLATQVWETKGFNLAFFSQLCRSGFFWEGSEVSLKVGNCLEV